MMDENSPLAPKPFDLERLSEDELEARIVTLATEIEACKGELAKKRAHRSAADALFSKD